MLILLTFAWPIWLVIYGPHPIPQWMIYSLYVSIALPMALIGIYIVYKFIKYRSLRLTYLDEMGFQILGNDDTEQYEKKLINGGTKPLYSWTLDEVRRNTHRQHACDLLFLSRYVNRTKQKCSLCSVPAETAPDTVQIKKSPLGFHRLTQPRKYRVGSKSFNKKWRTVGDFETSKFFLTEEVEKQLGTSCSLIHPMMIWCEDRFYYGFIGTPTDTGIDFMIDQAFAIARSAGILDSLAKTTA